MRIQELHIGNFRNYREYRIAFGGRMTVLIGKNGIGKTNILQAIIYALSCFFNKWKGSYNSKFLQSSKNNIKKLKTTDAFFGVVDNREDYHYPVSIGISAVFSAFPLRWRLYKESLNSTVLKTDYEEASNLFWNIGLGGGLGNLPVLCYYSDSFPHIKDTLTKGMRDMLASEFGIPQNSGYYKWDEEENCTSIWETLFTDKWKNAKFKGELYNEKYVSVVKQTLIAFSSADCGSSINSELELKDVTIESRGRQDVMVLVFKDGRKMMFEQLPQGYRRIFSIVFDIVSRAYILNRTIDSRTIEGVVIIDEMELHLHPSLAQDILQRLQWSFPNLQFIISTHSPSVLTNYQVSDDCILYALQQDEGELFHVRMNSTYGIDTNVILTEMMGAGCRDAKVQQSIEYIMQLIKANELENAKTLINELEMATDSNQPELIKLRSIIKRKEIIGR